jgi:hypothetical protein
MTVLQGQDSASVNGLQDGLAVYCGYNAGAPGYRNGSVDNYEQVKARFPGAKHLSFGFDAIDIEPGLAVPGDAPGFVRNWAPLNTSLPVCYADGSQMPEVIRALTSAGIRRNEYFLYLADPDGDPAIPSGYDAKQWEFNGNLYDSDSFYSYMWEPLVALGTLPAPTGFKARGGHTSVAFTWTPVGGATGYRIEIYDDPAVIEGGHWTVVKQADATSETVQTGGLVRGRSYQAHIWCLGSRVTSDGNYAVVRFGTV